CTDVINHQHNSPAATTAGHLHHQHNPFLPATHYNRLSHSNDGLNNIATGAAVGNGVVATGSTTNTSTTNSSSSTAYLTNHQHHQHHTNNDNDHHLITASSNAAAANHHNSSNNNSSSSSDIRIDERIIFNI